MNGSGRGGRLKFRRTGRLIRRAGGSSPDAEIEDRRNRKAASARGAPLGRAPGSGAAPRGARQRSVIHYGDYEVRDELGGGAV